MTEAKSQNTRLVDVFLLGPFMVWFACASRPGRVARAAMVTAGALTVLYNLQNWLHVAVDIPWVQGGSLSPPASDWFYALLAPVVFLLAYSFSG